MKTSLFHADRTSGTPHFGYSWHVTSFLFSPLPTGLCEIRNYPLIKKIPNSQVYT